MKILKLLATFPIIMLMAGTVEAETTCTITEKWQCAQGQVCQSIQNTIIIRINTEQQIYSRCNANGCDDYKAQFTVSGAFINIVLPANGLLAKLTTNGTSFTEVATLGTSVLLSFGSCS